MAYLTVLKFEGVKILTVTNSLDDYFLLKFSNVFDISKYLM